MDTYGGYARHGGGAFSGFMPSTSYFFPRRKQGTALGLQAEAEAFLRDMDALSGELQAQADGAKRGASSTSSAAAAAAGGLTVGAVGFPSPTPNI